MAAFLMSPTVTQQKWTLASASLTDGYTDFMLARQAMNGTRATLKFYGNTAGVFLAWIKQQSVTCPEQVTARHLRAYLAGLAERKLSDRTLHAHAQAVRTLLRFLHKDGYLPPACYLRNAGDRGQTAAAPDGRAAARCSQSVQRPR